MSLLKSLMINIRREALIGSSIVVLWMLPHIFFEAGANADTIYAELANEDQGIFQTVGDGFFGDDASDGNYSQGLYLSFTRNRLAGQKLSFSVEQDIFTPSGDNKTRDQAVIGDRPFAAFLGAGGNYIRRDGQWVQRAGIKLGVVGPDAMGKQMQDVLHENAVGTDGYNAWNDQVVNRYGVIGHYVAAWRLQASFGGMRAEFSPHGSLTTGNLVACEGIGATMRLGNHLDMDYHHAPFSLLSGGEYLTDHAGFSWSVFAGFQRRHMRKNYTLEGSTRLTHIQTVDMNNWVVDKRIGADIKWEKITFSMTFVERSPEFKGHSEQQFLRIGMGIDF